MEKLPKSNRRVAGRSKYYLICAILCIVAIAASMMSSSVAFATEGGGGIYPNGAEGFMAGAVPPPGVYLLNYAQYYWADRFNDKNGNSMIPNFKVTVIADGVRLLYVTNIKILGADYGMHVILPVVYEDVHLPVGNKDITEFGELTFDPLVLSWHFSKNFHAVAACDVNAPIGGYDVTREANPGRNYWNVEPVLAFTYLSDGGIEASSKFMYDFNFKNLATDYTSGQEFHFDYTLAYHIKDWAFGVGGYYYKQTTNDVQDGLVVGPDGFKGQAFAIGPQVMYEYKNMHFILKWQNEMAVENKPEGNKLWFKFIYAFK
ncbi:MAG: transporter [Dissulfurispiraceae bacterium]